METQKIVNLLNDSSGESSKFATAKLYVINDQNNTEYGEGNENDSSIKFETKVIKINLCDYSDAYILVTGDIKVKATGANTSVAFKNCAPFARCVTHTGGSSGKIIWFVIFTIITIIIINTVLMLVLV